MKKFERLFDSKIAAKVVNLEYDQEYVILATNNDDFNFYFNIKVIKIFDVNLIAYGSFGGDVKTTSCQWEEDKEKALAEVKKHLSKSISDFMLDFKLTEKDVTVKGRILESNEMVHEIAENMCQLELA